MAGCATPGSSIEVKQAPAASLAQYKTVEIEVTNRDDDFSSYDGLQLDQFLADDLRKSGRFEQISYYNDSSTEHADLKLSVLVEFVLLYNSKSIESSVTLTDTATGKTMAQALIDAHSESAFMGGHMTNAIAQLSNQIVSFATQR